MPVTNAQLFLSGFRNTSRLLVMEKKFGDNKSEEKKFNMKRLEIDSVRLFIGEKKNFGRNLYLTRKKKLKENEKERSKIKVCFVSVKRR